MGVQEGRRRDGAGQTAGLTDPDIAPDIEAPQHAFSAYCGASLMTSLMTKDSYSRSFGKLSIDAFLTLS